MNATTENEKAIAVAQVNAATETARELAHRGLAPAGILLLTAVGAGGGIPYRPHQPATLPIPIKDLQPIGPVNLGGLVDIQSRARSFCGIFLERTLEFTCEENSFVVPLNQVGSITIKGDISSFSTEIHIGGATYRPEKIGRLTVLSSAGIQTLDLLPELKDGRCWPNGGRRYDVRGVPFVNISSMQEKLGRTLWQYRQWVWQQLGEDLLAQFFAFPTTA